MAADPRGAEPVADAVAELSPVRLGVPGSGAGDHFSCVAAEIGIRQRNVVIFK